MTIKIFLGNLSSDTTSDKLRPLFEKYGEVVECDVLKNFGFVHMTNKAEANQAIAQLDGYNVDGNNIRVELSTGKKGSGGGGGKFDKKGFNHGGGGGGPRGRPYGPPPPRDLRDYDRYQYPPLPYDRLDSYYHRLFLEREAYYGVGPLSERGGYPSRDRYPLPPPRERLSERYPPPDMRDRIAPPRSFLEARARPLPDPYFRERDIAARPPPEYYDRKPVGAGRPVEPLGSAGARSASSYGGGAGGDFFRGLDRPGGNLGGGAPGLSGSGNGPADFLGRPNQGSYGRQNGPMGGGNKPGDSQQSFASDPIFF